MEQNKILIPGRRQKELNIKKITNMNMLFSSLPGVRCCCVTDFCNDLADAVYSLLRPLQPITLKSLAACLLCCLQLSIAACLPGCASCLVVHFPPVSCMNVMRSYNRIIIILTDIR